MQEADVDSNVTVEASQLSESLGAEKSASAPTVSCSDSDNSSFLPSTTSLQSGSSSVFSASVESFPDEVEIRDEAQLLTFSQHLQTAMNGYISACRSKIRPTRYWKENPKARTKRGRDQRIREVTKKLREAGYSDIRCWQTTHKKATSDMSQELDAIESEVELAQMAQRAQDRYVREEEEEEEEEEAAAPEHVEMAARVAVTTAQKEEDEEAEEGEEDKDSMLEKDGEPGEEGTEGTPMNMKQRWTPPKHNSKILQEAIQHLAKRAADKHLDLVFRGRITAMLAFCRHYTASGGVGW